MRRKQRKASLLTRQVFPSWTISMPSSMEETLVREGQGYWHAYDWDRSISLTSMALGGDDKDPPTAQEIVAQLPKPNGEPFPEMPDGVIGWAFTADAGPEARAGRLLSGIVAVDGRVLLATITCDDEAWSREIWLSIRYSRCHPYRRH